MIVCDGGDEEKRPALILTYHLSLSSSLDFLSLESSLRLLAPCCSGRLACGCCGFVGCGSGSCGFKRLLQKVLFVTRRPLNRSFEANPAPYPPVCRTRLPPAPTTHSTSRSKHRPWHPPPTTTIKHSYFQSQNMGFYCYTARERIARALTISCPVGMLTLKTLIRLVRCSINPLCYQ